MATTDSKPVLPALKTPLSATYPSELQSPMIRSAMTPTFPTLKREEPMKTPITPPPAYLDFLKTLSPALISPLPTGTSTKFVFEANRSTSQTSVTSAASSTTSSSTSAPTEKPDPKGKTSASSSSSSSSSSSRSSSCTRDPTASAMDPPIPMPMSAPPTKITTVTIPPPSPFSRPQSARGARTPRLYIPQSPFSPSSVRSPASAGAHSLNSPYSALSPKTWDLERKTGRTRRVSVREVVTRTVTYSSTNNTPVDGKAPAFPQIDPAPRGKRRKLE